MGRVKGAVWNLKRWIEYFQGLLATNTNDKQDVTKEKYCLFWGMIEEKQTRIYITREKLKEAIKKLKWEKAAGHCQITL